MPPPLLVPFGLNSYRSGSALSQQRCLNMYAEKQQKGAKTEVSVRSSPGIVDFATCGHGPIRAVHELNDTMYAVSGAYLYSVTSDGTSTNLGGQIGGGTSRVSIDDNGDQIVITDGDHGYVYDESIGFRVINDVDFHPANSNTTMDGFSVFDRSGANEIFISDSLDASAYSDFFASAETKSDNVLAVLNNLQLLHIFGQRTIEFWQNVGAANFPFRRVPGGVIDRGIAGPRAYGREDNTVYTLGDDRIGYRIAGMKLEKITTPPIDEHWQAYESVGDAEVFGYTFEGHKFIVYNVGNETWVYDISTGLFHERSSRDIYNNNLGRWRGNCSTIAFDKTMVGDRFSGSIGYLDRTAFTEFDSQIIGEVVSPPMYFGGVYATMPSLEINLEVGNGVSSGQGEDPQVILYISDDGGQNFDAVEWASSGKIGAYRTQVRFGPLGGFYERTMKLRFADPVRWTLLNAYAKDLEVGS